MEVDEHGAWMILDLWLVVLSGSSPFDYNLGCKMTDEHGFSGVTSPDLGKDLAHLVPSVCFAVTEESIGVSVRRGKGVLKKRYLCSNFEDAMLCKDPSQAAAPEIYGTCRRTIRQRT